MAIKNAKHPEVRYPSKANTNKKKLKQTQFKKQSFLNGMPNSQASPI